MVLLNTCKCLLQVGLAAGSAGQPHLIITGCAADSSIKLSDVRMAGQQQQPDSSSASGVGISVVKTVSTDLRGTLTTMTVHSDAPLIAAGSSHQVRGHA